VIDLYAVLHGDEIGGEGPQRQRQNKSSTELQQEPVSRDVFIRPMYKVIEVATNLYLTIVSLIQHS